MKKNAALARYASALFDRLNCADFIIGMYDADQNRSRLEGPERVSGIDASTAINRQVVTCASWRSRNSQGSMIAGCSTDVVIIRAPSVRLREIHALKRQVVGFASAAGKGHFVSVATKQLRHLVASRLEGHQRTRCALR